MIFCKATTAVYATYRSWLWASCLFESCSGDAGCSCACGGCYTGCCYSPSGGSRFGVGSERQEEAYGQGEEGIGIGISNISGIRDGLGAFLKENMCSQESDGKKMVMELMMMMQGAKKQL